MVMFGKWFGKKREGKDDEVERRDEPAGSEAPAAAPSPAAPPAEPPEPPEEKKPRWGLLSRALSKTRTGLKSLFSFRRQLDEALVDEIEASLFAADFGPEAVGQLIHGPEGLRAAWKEKRIAHAEDTKEYLKGCLRAMLRKRDARLAVAEVRPTVILVAGVNGAGKTTSIAKLTKKLRDEGATVILAAADTFRAAAVEHWQAGGRSGLGGVRRGRGGARQERGLLDRGYRRPPSHAKEPHARAGKDPDRACEEDTG
jgi:fused signal recognition particle receptor